MNPTHLDSFFFKWISKFYSNYNFDNVTDAKTKSNPYRTASKTININSTKKLVKPFNKGKNINDDLVSTQLKKNNFYTWDLFNESKNYRFKDLNSTNLSFLTADKNIRLLLKKKNWRTNRDFTTQTNLGGTQNSTLKLGNSLFDNYQMSKTKW
jgi:hypothetical protein